ncbi:unnamed protein product [Microthlaspi erraticum]|uniref:Arabidopsis retrotransposon Orf1 C-terminal domain-containing protein n=1 Tax=Microthlaspi erraticum TaxID=1685480 RepID=A0A6D2HSY8_9BRAS|nr:unnamed protein product [Microthlaspi erraticum]
MDDSMIPRPYGVRERIRILRRMQFMSMRYPHPETIKRAGIEDVNDILYYTELGEFTKLALPAYRNQQWSSCIPETQEASSRSSC